MAGCVTTWRAPVVGSSRVYQKNVYAKNFLKGKKSKKIGEKRSFFPENNTGSPISPAAVRICGG
jgi:hypothetical protein